MYFPRLYPDELLYSAMARCRVHLGIINHKVFLNQVFANPLATAITDLPNHLQALSENLREGLSLSPIELAYQHTLLPIYGPFMPEERRKRLLAAMLAEDSDSVIGLAGITTCLIKWPTFLRYCPYCLSEMADIYGEFYWKREWQLTGVITCTKHGICLLDSNVPYRRLERHEFLPASPENCSDRRNITWAPRGHEAFVAGVRSLLTMTETRSPNYSQWSLFYHRLAAEQGAVRGAQVRIPELWYRFGQIHSTDYLSSVLPTYNTTTAPGWFLALFRKHRKSFSFLQHLLVLTAFRPHCTIKSCIEEAQSLPQRRHAVIWRPPPLDAADEQRDRRREKWKFLLSHARDRGIKVVRQKNNALYAWLYRHDRNWLLATNAKLRIVGTNNRHVDWRMRDRNLVRMLIHIRDLTTADLNQPRKSRNWYLGKLSHRASVTKHLAQLPLCRTFFQRYSETIGEYQIRRIIREMNEDARAGTCSMRWELERRCGLDKRRIRPEAAAFLSNIWSIR